MLHFQIAELLDLTIGIHDHDGYVLVASDDLQHKSQIGVLIGIVERAQGFRPHLHIVTFLLHEVTHKQVGHHKRRYGNEHSCHHKQDFHLPNSICPYHTLLITCETAIYCTDMLGICPLIRNFAE